MLKKQYYINEKKSISAVNYGKKEAVYAMANKYLSAAGATGLHFMTIILMRKIWY